MVEGGGERVSGDVGGGGVSWVLGRGGFWVVALGGCGTGVWLRFGLEVGMIQRAVAGDGALVAFQNSVFKLKHPQ